MEPERRVVDVRFVANTTWVVVGVVFAALGLVLAVDRLSRVLTYLVVALFFAVILTPPVNFLQHRARMRRGVATLIVFMVGLATLSGLIYAFVKPLVDQGGKFVDDLPTLVEDAERGEGAVGRLVERYELQDWVKENRDDIQQGL